MHAVKSLQQHQVAPGRTPPQSQSPSHTLTSYPSPLTPHLSPLTPHLSPLTSYLLPLTYRNHFVRERFTEIP